MVIIPAIDIKDGYVVRLFQGRFSEAKVYSRDPVETARQWTQQGAQLLHIIDLDGAYSGVPQNLTVVDAILKEISVPVQFGGGARSLEAIRDILARGVSRVTLGTRAAEDRDFLTQAWDEFKERVIVSIDALGIQVLVNGWQENARVSDALAFAHRLKEIGFQEIIYTDTAKDGTLEGPNIEGIKAILTATGLRVIASGGISSLEDLRTLKALEKSGVIGVIVGKALYEGKFTLKQALEIAGVT